MEKKDTRRQRQEVQQALRDQIIRLREQGKRNKDIAEFLGVSPQHASMTWQKYIKGGDEAIALRKRGRRYGHQRSLASEQEQEIKNLIMENTPDQIGLPYALWTRDAVREAINVSQGIVMPIRTVGDYLSRWGFTPQKPIKRAREQSPKAVDNWLRKEYPRIAANAKKEKAEISWGDETGIHNGANLERGFARSGKPPVVLLSAKKAHIGMISAISNVGKIRFMMYREAMTSRKLITFLSRLIKDTHRKVYLILDNLKVHHSKKVTGWLEAHKDMIAIFHLPAYSPELNPDEYLNGSLKRSVHSGTRAHTESELRHKTESFMRTMVKRPHNVRSFFHYPKVAYAA